MRVVARLTMLAALLFVAISGAQAQTPGGLAPERVIAVTGEGVVRGRPDIALITLGVVSEAPSAREALSANTQSMGRIIEALRTGGTASRDLQTSGFMVEPVYSQPPADYDPARPFEPKIVGYRVRNELTLRIRDIARTGAALDQVVTLGANSISGPSFTVADPTPLEDQARRAAMRDALRKGELYAMAANIPLGPVLRIEEGAERPPPPIPMSAMAREAVAADASVPVEGGELTFQAQVSVTWRLGR